MRSPPCPGLPFLSYPSCRFLRDTRVPRAPLMSPPVSFPFFSKLRTLPGHARSRETYFAYTQTACQSVPDRLGNGESVAPHVKKRSARFRTGATTFKHNRNYACMCLQKPCALTSLAKGSCVSLKKVTFMPKLLADARSRSARASVLGILDSFHKLRLKFILRIGTRIRSNLC